jgi:hypothetical protein
VRGVRRPLALLLATVPPVVARLRRLRSTGSVYGELDPERWFPVERQNPRTLWLVTPRGVVDVARQDVELRALPLPSSLDNDR